MNVRYKLFLHQQYSVAKFYFFTAAFFFARCSDFFDYVRTNSAQCEKEEKELVKRGEFVDCTKSGDILQAQGRVVKLRNKEVERKTVWTSSHSTERKKL